MKMSVLSAVLHHSNMYITYYYHTAVVYNSIGACTFARNTQYGAPNILMRLSSTTIIIV